MSTTLHDKDTETDTTSWMLQVLCLHAAPQHLGSGIATGYEPKPMESSMFVVLFEPFGIVVFSMVAKLDFVFLSCLSFRNTRLFLMCFRPVL